MSTHREIILDTETTGMDPDKGDRIVEIGCVEVINLVPTGRTFHKYINPERDVPAEAAAVHGLTTERLKGEPVFVDIAADFVEFIGDAPIVAHNAPFDVKFINAELLRCGFKVFEKSRVIDTLVLARKKFPGAPASLDALCRRFNVDNSGRTFHGALLDAELLAEVYLELRGGRQAGFSLDGEEENTTGSAALDGTVIQRVQRPARPHAPTDEERTAHTAFLKQLKDPLWTKLATTNDTIPAADPAK